MAAGMDGRHTTYTRDPGLRTSSLKSILKYGRPGPLYVCVVSVFVGQNCVHKRRGAGESVLRRAGRLKSCHGLPALLSVMTTLGVNSDSTMREP